MSDRIKIVVDDISFEPLCNRVLIKVDVVTGLRNGIYVGDAEWDQEGHCTRMGTIVKLPSRLFFRSKGQAWGSEWRTTLEVKEGDEAYWGLFEATDCPVILCGSDVYYLVNYSEIRMVKRDGVVIPVNGYVLVKKVEAVDRSSVLIVDHTKKQLKNMGVVMAVGKPNDEYFGIDMHDPKNLSVGDKVQFSISAWTPLEDERYATFDKGVGYIQGRWIIASY